MDRIERDFNQLKTKGLDALNPDQSSAMLQSFIDVIEVCIQKGFSTEDIIIIFDIAMENIISKSKP